MPNVWVAPSENMVGGRFKFDDYFSTLDHPKEMVPESDLIFKDPKQFDPILGTYLYSKRLYRKALMEAVKS